MKNKLNLQPIEPASPNLEGAVLAADLYNWLLHLATGKPSRVDHITDEDDWKMHHQVSTACVYDHTSQGKLTLYVQDGRRITTARINTPIHQRSVRFSETGQIEQVIFELPRTESAPFTCFRIERSTCGTPKASFVAATLMDFEGKADQEVSFEGVYSPNPTHPDLLTCQSLLLDGRQIYTCGTPEEIDDQGQVTAWHGGKEDEDGLGYYPSVDVVGQTEIRITGGRTVHIVSLPEIVPNLKDTASPFTNPDGVGKLLSQATCHVQTDHGRGKTETVRIY